MDLQLSSFYQATWGIATLLQAGLLVTLLARGLHRRFPALTAYLSLNLARSLTLVLYLYPRVGFHSLLAWQAAWISQGVVIVSRAIAVGELCHHVLARFKGIWAIGWRVLAMAACVVLVAAISLGRHDFAVLVLTLDLGVELAIAAAVVGLFVFAKHYDLRLDEPLRSLGLGFCFYSCVFTLNDLLMQQLLRRYSGIWNLVDTITFIASVTLWLRAFLRAVPSASREPALLDARVYPALMPEVNRQLALLNEELSRIWRPERHST